MNEIAKPQVITATSAPIFFSFFTWGFGTGAQQLARPLFAYQLTNNLLLVSLVIAMNAIPRWFTAPITGILTDRFGRRPLVIFGATLRGITNVGQFMSQDIVTFLVLEFIGQIGVSMWGTSSNVLLADVTTTGNRGRVLAVRQMSMRLGFIAGPLLGGVLAAAFGLRSLFLMNGLSKIIIVVVVLLFVTETLAPRSERPATAQENKGAARRAVLQAMRTRSFAALAFATIGMSMTQVAVLQTLLPIHAQEELGASTGEVGLLITVAAILAFLIAYPNGMISDRFGRKKSMVPGLLFAAAAMGVLASADLYVVLIVAVAVLGIGEGMTMGASQTYGMDIAPPEFRGAFLGFFMLGQSMGAFTGPLIVGTLYNVFSPTLAFGFLAVWLVVGSLGILFLGKETGGLRRAVESTRP